MLQNLFIGSNFVMGNSHLQHTTLLFILSYYSGNIFGLCNNWRCTYIVDTCCHNILIILILITDIHI